MPEPGHQRTANHLHQWPPRSRSPSQDSRAPMLPGFRFLFAAIMLSMSLLVFGLGAAALLRAAHESFASNSSWRAAPEVTFGQQTEPTIPMLATLRVDTVAEKAPDPIKVAAAPAEPVAAPAPSASSPQVAASSPAETPAIDVAKPDIAPAQMPVAESPPAPEAAPAPKTAATTGETTTLVTTDETKTAAVAVLDESSGNGEPATPQPAVAPANPAMVASTTATASTTAAASTTTTASAATSTSTAAMVSATSSETSIAATKIATLGGPPVDIVTNVKEKTAKPERAKDDPSAVEKRVHARRIARRRRLAARARLAAQQLQLQQNPFAQLPVPAPVPATRARQTQ